MGAWVVGAVVTGASVGKGVTGALETGATEGAEVACMGAIVGLVVPGVEVGVGVLVGVVEHSEEPEIAWLTLEDHPPTWSSIATQKKAPPWQLK